MATSIERRTRRGAGEGRGRQHRAAPHPRRAAGRPASGILPVPPLTREVPVPRTAGCTAPCTGQHGAQARAGVGSLWSRRRSRCTTATPQCMNCARVCNERVRDETHAAADSADLRSASAVAPSSTCPATLLCAVTNARVSHMPGRCAELEEVCKKCGSRDGESVRQRKRRIGGRQEGSHEGAQCWFAGEGAREASRQEGSSSSRGAVMSSDKAGLHACEGGCARQSKGRGWGEGRQKTGDFRLTRRGHSCPAARSAQSADGRTA